MSWANQYVGIPYKRLGRSRAGIDCYGLVRLVLAEQLGIHLPSFSADEERVGFRDDEPFHPEGCQLRAGVIHDQIAIHGFSTVEAGERQAFDVAVMRAHGDPMHLGIMVRPTLLLHTFGSTASASSAIVDITLDEWACKIIRCVRHKTQ